MPTHSCCGAAELGISDTEHGETSLKDAPPSSHLSLQKGTAFDGRKKEMGSFCASHLALVVGSGSDLAEKITK